jgi:hypothetical protein
MFRALTGKTMSVQTDAADYFHFTGPASYGRKVEQAIAYRRRGFPILLVHEYDFRDAIA